MQATMAAGVARALIALAHEARCAYSRREFACKNSIALKESRETSYWLRLIDACELAPRAELEPLRSEAREISAILGAIFTF